jgi:tripartite-type tricarboxylate transporter receptor subunit TctC
MRYIKICLTFMALGLMQPASAQGGNGPYPNRPLTVVVPMSVGGTSDLIARMLMPALGNLLGQSVMVENRVGANGAIGEDYFSRAKPDGYTLMLESTSIATNAWMNTLSYDPRSAFIPVIQIASVPLVLVVNSKLSASNAGEFLSQAKSLPGGMNYASWGNGSIGHFAGEKLQIASKLSLTHVPYKSTAQAISDTLSGQVQVMFPTLPLAIQHLRSGKIRALALTSATRSPMAPDIPTMAEAGIPGMEIETWFGMFLPKGTPTAIVQTVQSALQTLLSQPDIRSKLEAQGFRVVSGSSADFSQFYLSEIEQYGRIVKQANLKPVE